jgi:hypothetical protein
VHDRPQARTAPLVRSPCRGDRFPRSMQEPEPSSRHLHAGRHLGSQKAPPRLIPGLQSIPGFDVTFVFRHVISGSLSLAFLAHTCRAQRRDFSRDAHHHGSLPQQLTVVCGLRLHGGRGGPPSPTGPGSSISCTAPHSESGSSTSSLLQRSWHTLGRPAIALTTAPQTIAFAGAKRERLLRCPSRSRLVSSASAWHGRRDTLASTRESGNLDGGGSRLTAAVNSPGAVNVTA